MTISSIKLTDEQINKLKQLCEQGYQDKNGHHELFGELTTDEVGFCHSKGDSVLDYSYKNPDCSYGVHIRLFETPYSVLRERSIEAKAVLSVTMHVVNPITSKRKTVYSSSFMTKQFLDMLRDASVI